MDAQGVENSRFNPSVLDLDRIEGRVGKSLVRKVRKLVEDFPDQALIVIRGWMAQGV
jgi:hypothetical protein